MNAIATTVGNCTPEQQRYARTLMREAELATDRFTFQHRVPFKAAKLPEPPVGAKIDAHLSSLSKAQASALISALQELAGVEDDDQDQDDRDGD